MFLHNCSSMTRSRKLTVAHATISLKTLLRLSCTPPLGLHSLKGAFLFSEELWLFSRTCPGPSSGEEGHQGEAKTLFGSPGRKSQYAVSVSHFWRYLLGPLAQGFLPLTPVTVFFSALHAPPRPLSSSLFSPFIVGHV